MVEFDRLYDGCKVKVVDKFLPNFNIPFASRYEGRTVTVRAALSPMRIEIYEDGGEFLWVVYDFDYIVDEEDSFNEKDFVVGNPLDLL